jgi:hypothetical protein
MDWLGEMPIRYSGDWRYYADGSPILCSAISETGDSVTSDNQSEQYRGRDQIDMAPYTIELEERVAEIPGEERSGYREINSL